MKLSLVDYVGDICERITFGCNSLARGCSARTSYSEILHVIGYSQNISDCDDYQQNLLLQFDLVWKVEG
jgi:hypothetical protein